MKWKKARKKPIIIEFREAEPKEQVGIVFPSIEGINETTDDRTVNSTPLMGEIIYTLEGHLIAVADNHFIIRGVNGEVYPIKKEIFYKTYDVLETPLEYYEKHVKPKEE